MTPPLSRSRNPLHGLAALLLGAAAYAPHAAAASPPARTDLFESNRVATSSTLHLLGDFDEDGREDAVAFSSTNSTRVSVGLWTSDETGRFTLSGESELPLRGLLPITWVLAAASWSLTSGDFNGDGHLDLAAAISNSEEGAAALLYGHGDGTFGFAASYTLGPDVGAIASADLDRDGLAELILAKLESDPREDGDHHTGIVQVMWNDGSGGLQLSATRYPSGEIGATVWSASTQSVSYGALVAKVLRATDLDRDGLTDLVIASGFQQQGLENGQISVLYGTGASGFQPPVTLAEGFSHNDVAVGDLNGDGLADLATTRLGHGQIALYFADGARGFGEPLLIPTEVLGDQLAIADFNGDGHPDVANGGQAITLLLGNGDGNFPNTDTFLADPGRLSVTDFDGDGRRDLLIGGPYSATALLNGGDPRHPFHTRTVPIANTPVTAVSGDFNGDGHPDVVSGEQVPFYDGPSTVSLLLGDGQGGLAAAGSWPVGTALLDLASADLDGDGHLDLVAANRDSSDLTLLFGDGGGAFPDRITLPTEGTPRAVTTADLDGDGHGELIVTESSPHRIEVYRVDEARGLAITVALPQENPPRAPVVADFTGDGHPDLATFGVPQTDNGYGMSHDTPGESGALTLFVGDGAGGFTARSPFGIGRKVSSLIAVDYDGDGALDLLAHSKSDAIEPAGELVLLVGDGNGAFPEVVSLTSDVILGSAIGVQAGDFDGDGHPDVATARGYYLVIYFGDGARGVAESVVYPVGRSQSGLAGADLNSDGAPDLLPLVGYFLPAVKVLLRRARAADGSDCPAAARATLSGDLGTFHLPQVGYRYLGGERTVAMELERAPALPGLVYRLARIEALDDAPNAACSPPSLALDLALTLPRLHYQSSAGDALFEVLMDYRTSDDGDYFQLRELRLLDTP
ncbi:hypothetical protein JCM17961_13780 [Endothiovibrio diazotrophicus]